jgi:hypothetical protein
MAVVLAGDFNAMGLARSGQGQADAFDRAVEHGYSSAYQTLLGREPIYTSIKADFCHTIDYCLYQNGSAGGAALTPFAVWDVDQLPVWKPLSPL